MILHAEWTRSTPVEERERPELVGKPVIAADTSVPLGRRGRYRLGPAFGSWSLTQRFAPGSQIAMKREPCRLVLVVRSGHGEAL